MLVRLGFVWQASLPAEERNGALPGLGQA
jgi:hypothetical protein